MQRRTFIEKSSLAALGLVTSAQIPVHANEKKLKVGLIGCGWYGMVITLEALKYGGVEVIAICDVDSSHLKNSAEELEKLQGTKPVEFKDYKKLLEVKELEAVFIGTPPHWHALQFIAACKRGLDIYCEKPLAYDVEEGAAMVRAAREAGNIVQVGFQRRQGQSYHKVKEMIQSGKAGNIRQVEAQIHYNPGGGDTTIQDPPSSLDWEAWCGPAPKLPYRPSIGHKAWRLEKEYGNGHLVDWGIHHIDIIRKIMDLEMPVSFSTQGELKVLKGKITTPDTLHAVMEFERFPVIWQHRLWGTGDMDQQYNNGIFFYGEKGTIFTNDNTIVFTPNLKNGKQEQLKISTPEMQHNHVAGFIEAVKTKDRSLLSCTVEDAWHSTASVQLAMISYYSDSKLNWDMNKKLITGSPSASAMLARAYREGYVRPDK